MIDNLSQRRNLSNESLENVSLETLNKENMSGIFETVHSLAQKQAIKT